MVALVGCPRIQAVVAVVVPAPLVLVLSAGPPILLGLVVVVAGALMPARRVVLEALVAVALVAITTQELAAGPALVIPLLRQQERLAVVAGAALTITYQAQPAACSRYGRKQAILPYPVHPAAAAAAEIIPAAAMAGRMVVAVVAAEAAILAELAALAS